jgi:hypothetical protein
MIAEAVTDGETNLLTEAVLVGRMVLAGLVAKKDNVILLDTGDGVVGLDQ